MTEHPSQTDATDTGPASAHPWRHPPRRRENWPTFARRLADTFWTRPPAQPRWREGWSGWERWLADWYWCPPPEPPDDAELPDTWPWRESWPVLLRGLADRVHPRPWNPPDRFRSPRMPSESGWRRTATVSPMSFSPTRSASSTRPTRASPASSRGPPPCREPSPSPPRSRSPAALSCSTRAGFTAGTGGWRSPSASRGWWGCWSPRLTTRPRRAGVCSASRLRATVTSFTVPSCGPLLRRRVVPRRDRLVSTTTPAPRLDALGGARETTHTTHNHRRRRRRRRRRRPELAGFCWAITQTE